MSSARTAAVILTTFALALTGCSTTVSTSSDPSASASRTISGAAATPVPISASEGITTYPLTIDNCGVPVTFTAPPKRVVIMNGGSVGEVSSMLALGLGDRIVANAQSYGASDEPGRVDAIAALPTGNITLNDLQDIPREAMLALKPDFVISTYGGGFSAENGFATRDNLRGIGANAYSPASMCSTTGATTGAPTVEDSYALLRDLGAIFDVPAAAQRVIESSKAAVASASAAVQGAPRKNVLLIFPGMGMGGSDSDFSAIAGNGIWNDIISRAGATNPFDDPNGATFVTISKEQLAATPIDGLVVVNYRNPDIDANARRILDQFPQWPAAKNANYAVVSDSIYLGPSNALAVAKIAALVHPDLVK